MSKIGEVLNRPLPSPPDSLRRGPFREDTFTSTSRSERTTSVLGLWLAATFGICFVTGLISHFIQQPVWWLSWPTRPISLYRITQGLHVATGLASIPLLLAKLWSVFPKLFTWPPVKDIAEAFSRLGILVLVGSAVFQLMSGLVNIARWYAAMPFFFTVAHYWTAWICIGALLMHIGGKLYIVRRAMKAKPDAPMSDDDAGGLPRRGFLISVGAGVAAVTLATVGQTVPALQAISRLAPREPDVGPQGLPVNKSASAAGVLKTAVDPNYTLTVAGSTTVELTLSDLQGMQQHTVELPIACVEGWSSTATWTGVRLSDVLALTGFTPNEDSEEVVMVESIQTGGLYRASEMPGYLSADPLTLLALEVNGEVLHIDHGYPVRLIAPNRPGVLQTKWVNQISVQS